MFFRDNGTVNINFIIGFLLLFLILCPNGNLLYYLNKVCIIFHLYFCIFYNLIKYGLAVWVSLNFRNNPAASARSDLSFSCLNNTIAELLMLSQLFPEVLAGLRLLYAYRCFVLGLFFFTLDGDPTSLSMTWCVDLLERLSHVLVMVYYQQHIMRWYIHTRSHHAPCPDLTWLSWVMSGCSYFLKGHSIMLIPRVSCRLSGVCMTWSLSA